MPLSRILTRLNSPAWLFLFLCTQSAYAQNLRPVSGGKLYLLTGTPTPISSEAFPSDLYQIGPEGQLTLVREVVPAGDGLNSVEVSFDAGVVSMASPRFNPSLFYIVRMDNPGHPEKHSLDYVGSGFNVHLLDLPGHRLIQSLVNVWSPAEEQTAALSDSTLPLPSSKLLEANSTTGLADRTRLLGIDLSPGADLSVFELPESDYGYLATLGRSGGGILSVTLASNHLGPDGKTIAIATRPGPIPAGAELPFSMQGTNGDLIVFHVVNAEIIAVTVERKRDRLNPSRRTVLHVFDRSKGEWESVPVPGNSPMIRGFGSWISVTAADENRDTPERLSPGKKTRRTSIARTGGPTDRRFSDFGLYFPGSLFLYNAATHSQYKLETSEGDSEILLVTGTSVFYRVNDQLFSADADAGELRNRVLLATADVIRDVHWAFPGH